MIFVKKMTFLKVFHFVMRLAFGLLASCLLYSCAMEADSYASSAPVVFQESEASQREKSWTFIVYMAADNNLEGAAIDDLNEMEESLGAASMNVLVLLDRAMGYDSSNYDWTSTRLYKVKNDDEHNKINIASEQLECPNLCLSLEKETELDMAKKSTLAGLLSFAWENYPADHYGLLVWGHGTGWRAENGSSDSAGKTGVFRAFAVDSSSDSYMTISSMREAIEEGMGGRKLDFIGFDTCFGVCAESAYEFRDVAEIMAGTPSIVSSSGWNYTKVFDYFALEDSELVDLSDSSRGNAKDFAAACQKQFREQYQRESSSVFCQIKLSKIQKAINLFDDFAKSAADLIDSYELRDKFTEVFQKKSVSYYSSNSSTDFYVDLRSVVQNVLEIAPELSEKGTAFLKSLDAAVFDSWSANGRETSLGVFYATYASYGVCSTSHPDLYINGGIETGASQFVKDCSGYVPTKENSGSLLDKIFYATFD
ncbi:clostripain-related cysteine peptidase [Treponema zioleckii]|uniref:clostripain-related cysteine peptidase n=1 Tax=Treponema zioleckii TaxID=331680 RepID=UPI00168AFD7A|nr:clostripain-related cysteine peptidase [Treponema zioleckii]